jgi:hypothetical protein
MCAGAIGVQYGGCAVQSNCWAKMTLGLRLCAGAIAFRNPVVAAFRLLRQDFEKWMSRDRRDAKRIIS